MTTEEIELARRTADTMLTNAKRHNLDMVSTAHQINNLGHSPLLAADAALSGLAMLVDNMRDSAGLGIKLVGTIDQARQMLDIMEAGQ